MVFKDWIIGHWRTLSLIVVIVLALISGVYAYWKLNNPSQPSPSTSTLTMYPIEFGMELNKTGFTVGEEVSVRLYLKNISNRSIVVGFNSGKVFDFIVRDTSGASVCVWSFWKYFTDGLVFRLLYPNDTFNRTLAWDQTYNSPDFLDKYQQQIPSGTYYVEGHTAPSFLASYWDGYTPIEPAMYYYGEPTSVGGELRTPEITVTIS